MTTEDFSENFADLPDEIETRLPRHHLLNAAAVRAKAHEMLALCEAGKLDHFTVHMDKLDACADFVIGVMNDNYPSGDVPFHARWRHFEVGGLDRWSMLADAAEFSSADTFGRAAFDLAITSVLLDAGAGADWKYEEIITGQTYTRSEGLGVASVAMFASGLFSGVPADPFRADASVLATLKAEELADGFQADDKNPMIGLQGRANLLNRLGIAVRDNLELFAGEDDPRPGGLFDALKKEADGGPLPAATILEFVLDGLGPIWPSRIVEDEQSLGDTWLHPKAGADGGEDKVPLHKLSQWLSYSLIEPLVWAGIEVVDIDGLTGLAEYRNGGLFLDSGVLRLKDENAQLIAHKPESALIVEWRALTVALLDKIAERIRAKFGEDAETLPLAKILEGGTWSAGRKLAKEMRSDGGPPLTLDSDGTVF